MTALRLNCSDAASWPDLAAQSPGPAIRPQGRHRIAGALVLSLGVAMVTTALAAPPRLPYALDGSRSGVSPGPTSYSPCPDRVTPVPALRHDSKFRRTDVSASEIDPHEAAQEQASVAPLRTFNRIIASRADLALRDVVNRERHRACVVDHLDHWARADALRGPNSAQGDFERKWGAITYALAFAEARSAADPAAQARITDWLRSMGQDVRQDYDGPPSIAALPRRANNHAYWAALSASTVAIAIGDTELFDWGMLRFLKALDDIGPDGLLPLELRRGARALEYHRFALEPLLMLALIARANAVAVPADGELALRRLIAAVRAGNESPERFAVLTGHAQVALDDSPRNVWVWAELAIALFPDAVLEMQIATHRPYVRTWLGGDLTLRFASHRR